MMVDAWSVIGVPVGEDHGLDIGQQDFGDSVRGLVRIHLRDDPEPGLTSKHGQCRQLGHPRSVPLEPPHELPMEVLTGGNIQLRQWPLSMLPRARRILAWYHLRRRVAKLKAVVDFRPTASQLRCADRDWLSRLVGINVPARYPGPVTGRTGSTFSASRARAAAMYRSTPSPPVEAVRAAPRARSHR